MEGKTNVSLNGLLLDRVVVDDVFHPQDNRSYTNYTRTFIIPESGLYYIDIRLTRAGTQPAASEVGSGATIMFTRPHVPDSSIADNRNYSYSFYSMGSRESGKLGVATIELFQYLEANTVITVATGSRSNYPDNKAHNGILIQKVKGEIPLDYKH